MRSSSDNSNIEVEGEFEVEREIGGLETTGSTTGRGAKGCKFEIFAVEVVEHILNELGFEVEVKCDKDVESVRIDCRMVFEVVEKGSIRCEVDFGW